MALPSELESESRPGLPKRPNKRAAASALYEPLEKKPKEERAKKGIKTKSADSSSEPKTRSLRVFATEETAAPVMTPLQELNSGVLAAG